MIDCIQLHTIHYLNEKSKLKKLSSNNCYCYVLILSLKIVNDVSGCLATIHGQSKPASVFHSFLRLCFTELCLTDFAEENCPFVIERRSEINHIRKMMIQSHCSVFILGHLEKPNNSSSKKCFSGKTTDHLEDALYWALEAYLLVWWNRAH